ncbi:MAG: hypothetical protein GX297_06885 [Treponema sp.]|jgi:hypothetical protein|nr:hypothetical protein [Treponema sp.]
MKSYAKILILFVVFLFISILLGGITAYWFQFISCKKTAEKLDYLPAIKPVRFLVYGSSSGTVSCHFSLYDRNSREIASIERSWNGGALYVDFATVSFNKTVLQFPLRIYSDYSKGGVSLKRYYLIDGICRIYSQFGEEPDEIKKIRRLCVFAFTASKLPFYKKYTSIKTIRLTSVPMGRICAIYISSDGNITILPD